MIPNKTKASEYRVRTLDRNDLKKFDIDIWNAVLLIGVFIIGLVLAII